MSRYANIDPLRNPATAFGALDEAKYRAELELVDRYQSFTAEILRLSLLGIAVFGFLYKIIFEAKLDLSKLPQIAPTLAAIGVLMFGISAALTLVFRFFAAEGARFYIQALRFASANADCAQNEARAQNETRAQTSLDIRHRRIHWCRGSKEIAALTLALGGGLEAVAVFLLILDLGRQTGA
jgi:hypothetical protein